MGEAKRREELGLPLR